MDIGGTPMAWQISCDDFAKVVFRVAERIFDLAKVV